MNERTVKIVDEHSIDRTARIMCGVDVDGTDYVIYSIKRDDENDNLFVSRLSKNNDGTSNMVNIEDSMEKSKLAEIVKELIKYSINNDADKTTGVVPLENGKEVKISGVMFNKEQSINVNKTYITTVKRATTKVGENFYNVEVPKPEPVVESVFDAPAESLDVFPGEEKVEETPIVEKVEEPVLPEVDPVLPEIPANDVAVPPILPEEPVLPDALASTVAEPVVLPEKPKVTPVIEPVEPILPEPSVTSTVPEPTPSVVPEAPANAAAATIVVPPKAEEPVVPPVSVVEPVPTPVGAPALEEKPMVFDASSETNLNAALGEVSKDNILPVSDSGLTSIKEFGQDEPVAVAPVVTPPADVVQPVMEQQPTGPVLTRKAGFANNKFFMVVAITFFLAACVFLGYEVFRYFKIVG